MNLFRMLPAVASCAFGDLCLELVKGPSESAGVLEINPQIHRCYFCSVALESFGLGLGKLHF